MQIICVVTAQLISIFIFATQIGQSLFFLNPKFQASILLLLLYRPVFLGPARNPNCCFSHALAHIIVKLEYSGVIKYKVLTITAHLMLHFYKYLLIMQATPLLGRVFCQTMKLFWLLIIVIVKREIGLEGYLKYLIILKNIFYLSREKIYCIWTT